MTLPGAQCLGNDARKHVRQERYRLNPKRVTVVEAPQGTKLTGSSAQIPEELLRDNPGGVLLCVACAGCASTEVLAV